MAESPAGSLEPPGAGSLEAGSPEAGSQEEGAWLSLHLHYHADRDLALRRGVLPLVVELRDRGDLEAFFFIRYRLGGPHLRLRLRPSPGRSAALRATVERRLGQFLRDHPSTASVDPEQIRRDDASIVANDGGVAAESPPPDNSLHEVEFSPEVSRYGGPARLPFSLALFQVSSCVALRFVDDAAGVPAGKRLTAAARLLIRQAAASARDGAVFAESIAYGTRWWRGWSPLLAKADAAFERAEATYRSLLATSVLGDAGAPRSRELELAAGALGTALGDADGATRLRILESQLHMTANRLGLSNADEAYLGGLLVRAVTSCRHDHPQTWRQIEDSIGGAATPSEHLAAAADRALDRLGVAPRPAEPPAAGPNLEHKGPPNP